MTRPLLGLGLVLSLSALSAPPTRAGLPNFCFNAEMEPPPAGCQFRFHPEGLLDELVVHVTLRDAFCIPVVQCSTTATITPTAGTPALCSCEGLSKGGFSDINGAIDFVFNRIGGRGSLHLAITARCVGNIAIAEFEVPFTSPDQDGSCDSAPVYTVNVVDMGIWAAGLGSYVRTSDFTCDGTVGVKDLGMWASGLGTSCP